MWLPIGWAKGPPPSLLPPLFSQCEYHGPPIGVGREKNISNYTTAYIDQTAHVITHFHVAPICQLLYITLVSDSHLLTCSMLIYLQYHRYSSSLVSISYSMILPYFFFCKVHKTQFIGSSLIEASLIGTSIIITSFSGILFIENCTLEHDMVLLVILYYFLNFNVKVR